MPAQKHKGQQLNSEQLRNKLKVRNQISETKLLKNHPEATKFFEKYQLRPGKIREHAARLLTSGALAGSLLLSPALPLTATPFISLQSDQNYSSLDAPGQLRFKLRQTVADSIPPIGDWKLSEGQEKKISDALAETFGVQAKAELDGHRLNNAYGRMGAEQHLPRFPGDNVSLHDELQEKGITPGLGAWGYFAYSKGDMTPELYAAEKWYVAVQTLYLPDWTTNTRELADWYKHRRVVVVNPASGKTVVAAIADAGPAQWTGKHFGGSPEVMQYLGINHGMQNHPVLLFFLDDPKKEVPLGPLEYNVKTHKTKESYKS